MTSCCRLTPRASPGLRLLAEGGFGQSRSQCPASPHFLQLVLASILSLRGSCLLPNPAACARAVGGRTKEKFLVDGGGGVRPRCCPAPVSDSFAGSFSFAASFPLTLTALPFLLLWGHRSNGHSVFSCRDGHHWPEASSSPNLVQEVSRLLVVHKRLQHLSVLVALFLDEGVEKLVIDHLSVDPIRLACDERFSVAVIFFIFFFSCLLGYISRTWNIISDSSDASSSSSP